MKKVGVRLYLAEDFPQYGKDITEKTFPEIQQSDGVLVAWTTSGSQSARVITEYAEAQRLRKPIMLLLNDKGVDRPPDWGDRELVHIRFRNIPFSIPPRLQLLDERGLWNKVQVFSFECLRNANQMAKQSPKEEGKMITKVNVSCPNGCIKIGMYVGPWPAKCDKCGSTLVASG